MAYYPSTITIFVVVSFLISSSFAYSVGQCQPPHNAAFSSALFRRRSILWSTTDSRNSNETGEAQKFVRGAGYELRGMPTPEEAAAAVGVKPTAVASKETWKRAWNFHKRFLKILHVTESKDYRPPNSSLSLVCLWLKAIAGNDRSSPVYDGGLTYDLLPPLTRRLVHPRLARFYPRLHHANIEIRTAFLDQSVEKIIVSKNKINASTKIRLISLGGGYDGRSIKLKQKGLIDEAYDLDLADVVSAKQILFERLAKRRSLAIGDLPQLMTIDLNKIEEVRHILTNILTAPTIHGNEDWHTIFLFEGVMIYLDEGIPSALLGVCSSVLKETQKHGSLCFADRLENIAEGDPVMAVTELANNDWTLDEWCPKPGLARHMGSAHLTTFEPQR
eukprot:CAMPEP_0198280206 /NCGR_PEP_ID=MMETSP1449-20131203/333_1 /TAXON_ID=420275 /ORGANISM="Attheya septentrionalis, Strain CCMP2084" /LENGTH=388 /DNA_ID=CAMNT_0043975495 /DNA_START=79 /DNA_END=1245 /DNA_ORIENTATION=+